MLIGDHSPIIGLISEKVYWVDLTTGRRPGIVVSRESLNQGNYVVMILCTAKRFAIRSKLPNCVPFHAGEFGMPSDCVAQCEAIYALEKGEIDIVSAGMAIEPLTRERLPLPVVSLTVPPWFVS